MRSSITGAISAIDERRDAYICPEGKESKRWAQQKREGKQPLILTLLEVLALEIKVNYAPMLGWYPLLMLQGAGYITGG